MKRAHVLRVSCTPLKQSVTICRHAAGAETQPQRVMSNQRAFRKIFTAEGSWRS
jgi:hypothetical protein